jgi:hypothetical protein
MNVELGTEVTQFPFWKYFSQFSGQYLCSADLPHQAVHPDPAHQAVYTDSVPDPCMFFVKKQRGNNFSIYVLHFKSLQDPGKALQIKPS